MSEDITFNSALIREGTGKHALPPPYVAVYEKDGKRLNYLTSTHEADTLPALANSVKKIQPKAIVGEIDARYRYRPGEAESGEAMAAARLAHESGIPFYGAEPSDSAVLQGLQGKGYNAKDQMGLYAVRMIPQWKKENPNLSVQALQAKIEGYFADNDRFGHIPSADRFTHYTEFQEWYGKQGVGKPPQDVTTTDFAPQSSGNATGLQRMHYAVAMTREEHINQVTQTAINTHGNVLVVYGARHFEQSQMVYESAMGKPALVPAAALAVDNSNITKFRKDGVESSPSNCPAIQGQAQCER